MGFLTVVFALLSMPLMLLGWLIEPSPQVAYRRLVARRERAFRATWLQLYGRR